MPTAINLRNHSKQQARRTRKARRELRTDALQGSAFEDLTPPQKDQLLKELLVRAGLIADSDDA